MEQRKRRSRPTALQWLELETPSLAGRRLDQQTLALAQTFYEKLAGQMVTETFLRQIHDPSSALLEQTFWVDRLHYACEKTRRSANPFGVHLSRSLRPQWSLLKARSTAWYGSGLLIAMVDQANSETSQTTEELRKQGQRADIPEGVVTEHVRASEELQREKTREAVFNGLQSLSFNERLLDQCIGAQSIRKAHPHAHPDAVIGWAVRRRGEEFAPVAALLNEDVVCRLGEPIASAIHSVRTPIDVTQATTFSAGIVHG